MEKEKALSTAIQQIERSYGKGSIMKLGEVAGTRDVTVIPTGTLPLDLALGVGGKTTDQQGALQTVARQPLGKLLLILVAAGLGGYALWRLVRALLGHGPEAAPAVVEVLRGLGWV